jgi:hypothetical protein
MVRHLYTHPLNSISRFQDFTQARIVHERENVIVCIMLRIRVNRGESSIVFYVLILLRLQPVHVEIFNVHASRNEKLNYIISTWKGLGGVPIYIIRETKIVI